MKFERHDWTIRLNEDKDIAAEGRQPKQMSLFETVFRTGEQGGKSCEIFTVMFKGADLMLVQVCIFEDGSTAAYSYVPTIIHTVIADRTIEIDMLCNFRAQGEQVFVSSIDGGSEYELTAFWV